MPSNEELAERVQHGDDAALEALWMQVKRLAYIMAKRYKTTAVVDLDDLLQCAYLGMHMAALAWRADGGGNFVTLMGWYVLKECKEAENGGSRKKQISTVSLEAPFTDDPDAGTLEDSLQDEGIPPVTAAMELEELRRDVRDAVAGLDDELRDAVTARYFDGLTREGAADVMGTTAERVRQLTEKALRVLRKNRVIMLYSPWREQERRAGAYGAGLSAFERYGMSSVERAVLNRWI